MKSSIIFLLLSKINKTKIEIKELGLLAVLALFTSVLVSAPYIFQNLSLPKVEELYYSVLPLQKWSIDSRSNFLQTWNSDYGLGTPWPIPQIMNISPLPVLFEFMPLYHAITVFLFFSIFIQAYFTQLICKEINMGLQSRFLTTITIVLASPVEYLISADALAVYFNWLVFPILIYTVIIFTKKNNSFPRLVVILTFGMVSFYAISNGHLGVLITYWITFPILMFFLRNTITQWFLDSMILATVVILFNLAKIMYFINEYFKFGSSVERIQYDYGQNFLYSIWALFLKPFPIIGDSDFNLRGIIMQTGIQNSSTRVLTLGSPIIIFILIIGTINYFKLQKSSQPKLIAAFQGVFVICSLMQIVPVKLFGSLISASWTFKDPAIFAGIILSGYYFNSMKFKLKNLVIIFHTILILSINLVMSIGPTIYNKIEDKNFTNARSLSTIIDGSSNVPIIKLLKTELNCESNECPYFGKRVAYSGGAASLLYDSKLESVGLLPNILANHGFEDVSSTIKGVSFDSISKSPRKFYGMISSENYDNFQLSNDEQDWVLQNSEIRDLLGIRIIISKKDELINTNGLRSLGEFSLDEKESIIIWKNSNAKTRLVRLVGSNKKYISNHQDCNKKFTLKCLNSQNNGLNSFRSINHGITKVENGYLLALKPSMEPNNFLLTEMWRPEWYSENAQLSNYYGLILIELPQGSADVKILYKPVSLNRIFFANYMLVLLTFMFLAIISINRFSKLNHWRVKRI